jgi:hypothetical protein
LITTFSALAGVIAYISANRIPEVTKQSVLFFILILISALVLDQILILLGKRVKYKVNFGRDITKFGR